jgi:cephalosporin hydroxylase
VRLLPSRSPRRLPTGDYRPPVPKSPPDAADQELIDRFHFLYYDSWRHGKGTIELSWFGHRTLKCPLDLWIYQEILVETRPDVVVESGTAFGGSALYLAWLLDGLDHGRVISIDTEQRGEPPAHPRIEYLRGSSTDPQILDNVRAATHGRRTMVILDSDHSQAHVAAELEAYRGIVSVGGYLIVEDTDINGHPARPEFGPGPMEALQAFLATTDDFEVDRSRERFLLTLNPSGYLRRLR